MYLPSGVIFDFLLDNAEAHLGLFKKSMARLFCETCSRLLTINYFAKNSIIDA